MSEPKKDTPEEDAEMTDEELNELRTLFAMFGLAPPRRKLTQYSTLDHAVELIQRSERIILVTGAGISVSCGIPDFRSQGGFYDKVRAAGFENPEEIFDISLFRQRPVEVYNFLKEMLPVGYKPSPTHFFIAAMDRHRKLLRDYTQNIDNLEESAGASHILQCHGSMGTASCLECHHRIIIDELKQILTENPDEAPLCRHCTNENRLLKPDVVFFGESLPQEFHSSLPGDMAECDLFIVIGSSLKVNPVAGLVNRPGRRVPQILINREIVGPDDHFDINLLGNCDVICCELARRLGWDLPLARSCVPTPPEPENPIFTPPNITLFTGAQYDPHPPEPTEPQPDKEEHS